MSAAQCSCAVAEKCCRTTAIAAMPRSEVRGLISRIATLPFPQRGRTRVTAQRVEADRLELAGDGRPREALLQQHPGGTNERRAERGVIQQTQDRVSECGRLVGRQEMAAWLDI